MSTAADIAAVLSYPGLDVKVRATPEPDGSRIVVETGGQTTWFSIGTGPSALVNFLLTSRAT